MTRAGHCLLLLSAIVVGLAGCGSQQVPVQGTVTANGKSVQDGYVTFQPVNSPGCGTYGAPIVNGKYSASVLPGKYAVLVIGGTAPAYPKSQEDLKKIADTDLDAEQIPADAKGNNQEVVISGSQELNLTVEFQPRKKSN